MHFAFYRITFCNHVITFGKYWSLVANRKRLLALDQKGDLLLLAANPEKFEVVDRRKVSVLYNAPERRPAAPAPSRAVTKSSSREKNVVFVGRLTFQKGPDHLLKAAALVTQRDPDVRFIFCGFTPMQWRLKALPAFTLPVPVTLNRFLAALLVFILGIFYPFVRGPRLTRGVH